MKPALVGISTHTGSQPSWGRGGGGWGGWRGGGPADLRGPWPQGHDAELGLCSRAARLPDRVQRPQQDTVFTLRTTRYVELGRG